MYTRYIPQPDGSFRRCHFPDPPKPQPPDPPCEAEPPSRSKPHERNAEVPIKHAKKKTPPPSPGWDSGFLRNILPKDFDTGDLIVVLLLLLMAGESREDQNTALLTLALYLFL